jgi:hypothetical protein
MHVLYAAGLLALASARRGSREDLHARRVSVFAGVLGARHAGEAVFLTRAPTPPRMHACALVDLLHAASMLALWRARPAWRGPALASAAAAGSLCAYAFRCAGVGRRTRALSATRV